MSGKKAIVVQTPPLMLAREQAAAALGISDSLLEKLVRTGELPPPRKISEGRVGWLWRDLQEFAESRPVSDLMPAGRQSPQGARTSA